MKSKQKIFISYSSKDRKFAEFIHHFLLDREYVVLKDDKTIPPGDDISKAVSKMVENATVLIAILSKNSIASQWVLFEISKFLISRDKNPLLKFIPIVIDDECQIPTILRAFNALDLRYPQNYDQNLSRILNIIEGEAAEDENNVYSKILQRSMEQEKMETMISSAINRGMTNLVAKLNNIVDVVQNQNYILSPESIAIKEATANAEIWVITTHLFNDINVGDIQESVKSNFEGKGILYKYFVNKSPVIRRRKKKYHEIFGKWSNLYEFITPPGELIMPFDELVLYDPLEPTIRWGYAQVKYNTPGKPTDDDLFLKLSDTHSSALANLLEKYVEYPEDDDD